MKTYIIKPEYLDQFGSDATSLTTLTETEVEQLAEGWNVSTDSLLDRLIEIRNECWTPIHRFPGRLNWQELNERIAFDSGVDEPYCEDEEAYLKAVKAGWIKFDGYYTTVYAD